MMSLTVKKVRGKNEIIKANPSALLTFDEIKRRDSESSKRKWFFQIIKKNSSTILRILIVIAIGFSYNYYVTSLFENLLRFSHLTNLEKEFSLPKDTAFHYSFFKRIAEADTFVKGLRSIIYDDQVNWPKKINSFQKFSLNNEVAIGFIYHLLKRFGKSIGWKFMENSEIESKDEQNLIVDSGIGNPLNFYLKFFTLIEILGFALIFYLGLVLSKSTMGAIMSVALFFLFHPQLCSSNDFLYPSNEKIGWVLALTTQAVILANGILVKRNHPSWTETVKISISTAALILVWKNEAQFILISQILLIALLHSLNVISRYSASLIVFGQINGWQYASLLILDTSFVNWSLYLYVLLSTIIITFLLQPFIERISFLDIKKVAKKKKVFIHLVILIISIIIFQITLFSIRAQFRSSDWISEDPRMPLNIFYSEESAKNATRIFYSTNVPIRDENYHLLERNTINDSEDKDYASNNKLSILMTQENEIPAEDESLILQKYLQFCHLSQHKLSFEMFIMRYPLVIISFIYVLIIVAASQIYYIIHTNNLKEIKSEFSNLHFEKSSVRSGEEQNLNERYSEKFYCQSLLSPAKLSLPLIIYIFLQTISFGFFALCLNKYWELLFITHFCVFMSLLFDSSVLGYLKAKFPFSTIIKGDRIHWIIISVLFATFMAFGKLQSGNNIQSFREAYEIKSQRMNAQINMFEWIRESTDVKNTAKFVGVEENLMIAISLYRRAENHFISKELLSIERERKLENNNGILLEAFEIFRKKISLHDFHASLQSLGNTTHLVFSKEICPSSQSQSLHTHTQTTSKLHQKKDRRPVKQQKQQPSISNHRSVTGSVNSVSKKDLLYKSESKRKEEEEKVKAAVASEKENAKKNLVFHWDENIFKEDEKDEDKNYYNNNNNNNKKRSCDITGFWDFLDNNNFSSEEDLENSIICSRLLHSRNIKPFKNVFQNNFFVIFSL